jgi:surface protein
MILKSGGNIMQYGNYALDFQGGDPYNPLNLPPFTIRCKFAPGYTPTAGDSQTLVDAEENIWDIYKNSTDWMALFQSNKSLLNVLGANSTGVTNMRNMFSKCSALTSLVIFDTSSVTNMIFMFNSCSSLTTVPLFNTRSCTNMNYMFNYCSAFEEIPLFDTSSVSNMIYTFFECFNVRSGALALYQQASNQAIPPTHHTGTFESCGINTITGAAELAQIPADWK